MKRSDVFENHYVMSQLRSLNILAHCNALNIQKLETNSNNDGTTDYKNDTSDNKNDSGVEIEPPNEPHTKRWKPSTKQENRPINEIRYDNIGHLPHIDEFKNPTRCKMEGCTLKSHIFCDKCKVHLCLKLDKNCYLKFHCETSDKK